MAGVVTGGLTVVDGVEYYRIDGLEEMEPFLTSVVSDGDLWMFASSNGALTAGRVDADHALFPYETDDKLHQSVGHAGPVTVIARTVGDRRELWRPFAPEPTPGAARSIAKSVLGDRLVYAEHHAEWGLTFRATWSPSTTHGWVRTVELVDDGSGGARVEVLDGLLDVMPSGVDAQTEERRSNLVDAYKRSEVGPWGTVAIYSIESQVTDRAEPAESLTATAVWSAGFDDAVIDLDARAVADMVHGRSAEARSLITGRPGAYLLRGQVTVPPNGSATWLLVADTGLAHRDVLAALRTATAPEAAQVVLDDVEAGSTRLHDLLAGADAFQSTAEPIADAHHLSNVLYNSMRGGVFPYGQRVPVADFADFLRLRNRDVATRFDGWIAELGQWVDVAALRAAASATGDPDLIRIVLEYLPIAFSRRHGDPSRPWNRFAIEVRNDDGSELLAYEGNWRDIFQNWEALLQSFPEYFAHVVAKFVNASTIDGFNPYRISRAGIDWEVPDPDDPWSHIGYWGDHQIVYLLRLLEAWERFEPGALHRWLDQAVFVYADVPYTLAGHDEMVRDPRNTITYDVERAHEVAARQAWIGADGQLVVDAGGDIVRVTLFEKLLVPALGKLTSLVPDGGIWLNTQRPEWNDANNALAGPGLSMVTLCHLRRYLPYFASHLDGLGEATVPVSASVAEWFARLLAIIEGFPPATEPIDDTTRRSLLDALGAAGTDHRRRTSDAVDGSTVDVPVADIARLCALATEHLEHTIRRARRADGLYDSYNLVSFPSDDTAHVDHLGPMLEGQVAALTSGALDAEESLALIDALFASGMYRADQRTFMLYPAVELPSFLERNDVPADATSSLLGSDGRLDDSLRTILVADGDRVWFHPDLANEAILDSRLAEAELPEADRTSITELYERVFGHRSFTGRSGSMYGFEGIGSVYWHMVGKLLVAVQEEYWASVDALGPDDVTERLAAAYRRVRSGLGFLKQPAEYGAFPTDCYSHTPAHGGARQPGMTGQVKEELLTRPGELGLRITGGRVSLAPGLLPMSEVIPTVGAHDGPPRASFTVCGVPMTIAGGEVDGVTVHRDDGSVEHRDELALTIEQSQDVFARGGAIVRVDWTTRMGPATSSV